MTPRAVFGFALARVRVVPWPETLTALAFVLGWLLVTSGVAEIAPPRIVWRVSLGVLALSLGGWKLFARMALDGLYILGRDEHSGMRKR